MALILTKRCFCPHSPRNMKKLAHYFVKPAIDLKNCYKILEIEETSDQEQIRMAYLKLVKQYHPDSGSEKANAHKFQEIDEAFKTLINKNFKERWEIPEEAVIQQDIKHTAPQHRQYLSFEGVGSGNPFQRERQYSKVRAMQAAENVYNHRVAKVTADDKALLEKVPLKHKIKTKYGFERLVEDLIQQSISKGEFNNLKGSGKPLPEHQHRNPYVDFITHKLNEVLIDNGFTPEWILLQKEIRLEANGLRKDLFRERQYFGPYPLSVEDNIEWSNIVYRYQTTVNRINKKIEKFNLVVPILDKQMVQVCLEMEAQKAVIQGKSYEDVRFEMPQRREKKSASESSENANLFGLIDFIFGGK
ncbi:dnaJ homolog subfamily C member 28 [Cylas formicarius]|uniref:dnaJ homolog subfamily C member 28 n=1 Tax=Cylas formicarius TaxID=197179 RepID=UPI0029588891|nr:dnaJ homolog subfamily C member 28 [Cylas formicarius]